MRRPSPAILGSLALHAGVIALAFVTFSHKVDEDETPLVASVPVTIVSEEVVQAAPADNPQPEPSPDPAASDAPPAPATDACAADQGPADPAPGDARTRPPRAPAHRAEPGPGRPGRTDAPDQQSRPPGDGAAGGRDGVPGHGPADHGHLQSGLSELDSALRHPRRGPAAHPGRADPVGRRADHARAQPDQRPIVERLPRRRRRRPARPAPDRALRRAARIPRRGLSPDLQHRTGVPQSLSVRPL